MPTVTDEAVCIRRWDFSETSQTVSLFTRTYGIIRALAKGAKREKAAFSGGLDLLTRGEAVAILKPGRDLATLTAWHLSDTYRWVRQSLPANRVAAYMADLIHQMLEEHDPHPELFDSFTRSLTELANAKTTESILLQFQWEVLTESGYRPELNKDVQTGRELEQIEQVVAFSPSLGGITENSKSTVHSWKVKATTVEVLRAVQTGNYAPTGDVDSLRRANRLLAAYLREIIGREPSSLAWVFPELVDRRESQATIGRSPSAATETLHEHPADH